MLFIFKIRYQKDDGRWYSQEDKVEAKDEVEAKDKIYEMALERGYSNIAIEYLDAFIRVSDIKDNVDIKQYLFKVERTRTGIKISDNTGILEFYAKRIDIDKEAVKCFLKVESKIALSDVKTIYHGYINLTSEKAANDLVKRLESALSEEKLGIQINWKEYVQQFRIRLLEEIEKGSSLLEEEDEIENEEEVEYLVYPYIIKNSPNLLYAHGGSGKTLLSLILSCSYLEPFKPVFWTEKPFKTLYLDYENNDIAYRKFKKLLQKTTNSKIDITRRGCVLPLAHDFENIAELIDEYKFDLLIVDSIILACKGGMEVDALQEFFRTLHALRVTTLLISHIPKNANKDNVSPYGSVYFFNLSRNIWRLSKKALSMNEFLLTLIHEKCNVSSLKETRSYKIKINDVISIEKANFEEFKDEVDNATVIIKHLQSNGDKTSKDIANELGINYNTVRTIVKRLVDKD